MLRVASFVVGLVVAQAMVSPASADVLKLFVEGNGGAAFGTASGGNQAIKDSAFFVKAPHGVYGALIGAEFLFLDGWIQHHQFTNGSRLATWTQFGLGVHGTIDTGDIKQQKAHESGYVEFAIGGWFGVGTGQQVRPPLDNAQITDKGFLVEGRLGAGKHLNSVFDLGVIVPVSWGYFFKNGGGAVANDVSTHYQSWQAEALVVLRANIRLL